ncbi:MAG: hypothetical protein LUH22_07505, partial [Bacteroides sp.]|nr:hypothetical protein [Bacteroides sp.]
ESRRDHRCITVGCISHGIGITIPGATKWVNNIGFTPFRAVWVELGRLFHGITSRGYAHQIPPGFL